jgi:hypothetical protein
MMRDYVVEVRQVYSSIVLLPYSAARTHVRYRCQDRTGKDVCEQGVEMGGKLHHSQIVSGEPQKGILRGDVQYHAGHSLLG